MNMPTALCLPKACVQEPMIKDKNPNWGIAGRNVISPCPKDARGEIVQVVF
jgi:hypothetical protein